MKKTVQSFLLLLAALLPISVSANDLHGDVNDDNLVTIGDVTSLIDYLLRNPVGSFNADNADANRDGNINITDVSKLVDFLLNGTWPSEDPQHETYFVNGTSFTMVSVEGGTFMMGATAEQDIDAVDDESPVHQVTLSAYAIGETEVSQELWMAVMGSNPSTYTDGSNLPVENVSWYDCQTFITKLNQLTGKRFRLPTEAEWEFAARGGNLSQGYKYAGSNDINEVAWYSSNSDGRIHVMATKAPNELGLFDMSGNVWEWCQDRYGNYSSEPQTDPTGPYVLAYRVIRGGSYSVNAGDCRVSNRDNLKPEYDWYHCGLRLAL